MTTVTKPDYGVVLKQMNGAIRRLEMYPPGHPATMQAIEKPFSVLQEVFKNEEHFIISRVEDKIVVNGKHLEGTELLKRFLEEFENQDVNSITINKSLTKEELNKFLGFFVKPLGKSTQTVSLPEFIRQSQIESIKVDQLRYELVTKDEVVVKSDVAQGANLKVQISKIIKDNPDLLRDILLNKPGTGEGLGGGSGEGTGNGLQGEVGGGPGEGIGDGPQVGIGGGSRGGVSDGGGTGDFRRDIEQHIKSISDDELLSLLVSTLEFSLNKECSDKHSVIELDQVVTLVERLLEDREKDRLLPRIKNILSERGIVKTEHLDFLFNEKWLKSQEVLDELMRLIEKLGTDEMDSDRFMFLWQRVISSDDGEIKSYAIDKLLSKIDSDSAHNKSLVISTLEKTLNHFIQSEMEFEFTFVKERLYQRIKDRLIPTEVFKDCSQLMQLIFMQLIAKHKFKEAYQILIEYHNRLNPETSFPEDEREVAESFVHHISDDSTLEELTSGIRERVAFQDIKTIEEILEVLDKDKVAKRLLGIFTLDDRTARMSALRVLSRLGQSSVSAFHDLISDPGSLLREQDKKTLMNDSWYKVRNVIYVLGNIPYAKSIELLAKLSQDPDFRVRLEVVKALEKTAKPEVLKILVNLLNDADGEVRKNVITSLTTLGNESCLEPLKQHLLRKREDVTSTIIAIGEIGKEKSLEFLLDLLWDKERSISQFASKTKDDIKVAALNVLGKIGPPELTNELERFVKHKRRGLKNLLIRDKVTEAATRALKKIENSPRNPQNGKKE